MIKCDTVASKMYLTLSGLSIASIISYFRESNAEAVSFFLSYFKEERLLTIVPWVLSGDGRWALRLDLSNRNKTGEIGYIPFPWGGPQTPSVEDAVEVITTAQVNYA
jgi:hypothetical protein